MRGGSGCQPGWLFRQFRLCHRERRGYPGAQAEAGAETGKEEDGGEKKEEAGASKDEKLIIYSPLQSP